MKLALPIATLSLLLANCASPAPTEEAEATVAEEVEATPPAREVTVAELIKAYGANEVAAQQEYGARSVALTGEVRGVVLDFSDDPAVLFESGQTRPVQALFDKKRGAATAALKKGQEATVVCNKVSEIMGLPILEDCSLLEPDQSAA